MLTLCRSMFSGVMSSKCGACLPTFGSLEAFFRFWGLPVDPSPPFSASSRSLIRLCK